jgi:hypothetical protein
MEHRSNGIFQNALLFQITTSKPPFGSDPREDARAIRERGQINNKHSPQKKREVMSYKVGQKVKVSESNDNENYDSFRDKILIITHAETGGLGYDEGMYPEKLMDFETEDGEEVPFALYEYEVSPI